MPSILTFVYRLLVLSMNTDAINHGRRAFLKGKFEKENLNALPLRPPWSIDDHAFTSLCSRCSACINGCPENILVKGDGGYPVASFSRGECSFCKQCVDACPVSALVDNPDKPPWTVKATIEEHCLTNRGVFCLSCGDECETRAITFSPDARGIARPLVTLSSCTGCGACVRVCPVSAIKIIQPNTPSDTERSHDHS